MSFKLRMAHKVTHPHPNSHPYSYSHLHPDFHLSSTSMCPSTVNASSLHSRLLTAEDDFLVALEADESALTSFSLSWTSLQHDIQCAQSAGCLTQEVAELAYIVSTRITTIAEAFEEFDKVAQDLSDELGRDLDQLLGRSPISGGVELGNGTNDNGKGAVGQS